VKVPTNLIKPFNFPSYWQPTGSGSVHTYVYTYLHYSGEQDLIWSLFFFFFLKINVKNNLFSGLLRHHWSLSKSRWGWKV